jgi:hypothetical protein
MGERLKTIPWLEESPLLRPRTGALRRNLVFPATTHTARNFSAL